MASYREVEGRWEARVSLGFDESGKRRLVSKRFAFKREAKDWAQRLELAPRASRQSLGQTVADLSKERLSYRQDEGLSAMHLANVRRFHEQWIIPGLGKEKLQKLTVARLREWSTWMQGEGLSDNQRRKTINELRAMFRQAEAEGLISSDPARHLKPPKEARKPAEAVDPKHLPALLGCNDPLVAIAVRIAADTGARRSNVLGLRFCDIEGQVVRLVYKIVEDNGASVQLGTKTGHRVHTVTVSEATADAIRQYRTREEQVAAEAGGKIPADGFIVSEDLDHKTPMSGTEFYHRWRKTLVALGLANAGLQFKGLRHLTASALLQAGMDPVRVADRLGHSVPVLLSTYAHVLPGKDSEAADIMSRLMSPGNTDD